MCPKGWPLYIGLATTWTYMAFHQFYSPPPPPMTACAQWKGCLWCALIRIKTPSMPWEFPVQETMTAKWQVPNLRLQSGSQQILATFNEGMDRRQRYHTMVLIYPAILSPEKPSGDSRRRHAILYSCNRRGGRYFLAAASFTIRCSWSFAHTTFAPVVSLI